MALTPEQQQRIIDLIGTLTGQQQEKVLKTQESFID